MKHYRVHRCPQPFDTKPDWSGAEMIHDFTFPWEPTAPPPTEFRALHDGVNLHFRFDVVDRDLVLGPGENLKQRVLGSDRVEIFLAPDRSLTPYYCFEMEPRGEVFAYRGTYHRRFDESWSVKGFACSSQLKDAGYTVQGSFTLEALREMEVLKAGTSVFHAGIYRAEFSRKPDGTIHSGWMPWVDPKTERPDFHVPESFGLFELV